MSSHPALCPLALMSCYPGARFRHHPPLMTCCVPCILMHNGCCMHSLRRSTRFAICDLKRRPGFQLTALFLSPLVKKEVLFNDTLAVISTFEEELLRCKDQNQINSSSQPGLVEEPPFCTKASKPLFLKIFGHLKCAVMCVYKGMKHPTKLSWALHILGWVYSWKTIIFKSSEF